MRRAVSTCLILLPLSLALAGCGYNRGDRALSGGLIGADPMGKTYPSTGPSSQRKHLRSGDVLTIPKASIVTVRF